MSSGATDPVAAQLQRAQGLNELQRYGDARTVLSELIGQEPDEPRAWCLLAQAQLGLEAPKAALEAAERAAALNPDGEWPHRLCSLALQQLGNKTESVTAAREAVAAAPHVWQTHTRLAAALVSAKRNPDEAFAVAKRSVELAPHQPNTFFTLGQVYDMRKDDAEAERCYQQALALDPQHAASHAALARRQVTGGGFFAKRGFGRAGDLASAATGYRNVVLTDPRSNAAARNIEIVLRVFISRLTYPMLLIAFIAYKAHGGSLGDRIVPLVLLAIPAAFAVRFLQGLAPDLRRRAAYFAFHGLLAVPSLLQACGIGLLLASSVVPEGLRAKLCLAAWLTSAASRIVLALEFRHRRRAG